MLGQKSLACLHRMDSSMIWNSYIYDKNFRWLSYNLWFAYIQFYKVIFFFDNYSFKMWSNTTYLNFNTFIYLKKKYFKINKTFIRFSYYVDLYCLEYYNYVLLINLFFKTNLFFYKKKNSNINIKKTKEIDFFN